jgi:hypothetical protein
LSRPGRRSSSARSNPRHWRLDLSAAGLGPAPSGVIPVRRGRSCTRASRPRPAPRLARLLLGSGALTELADARENLGRLTRDVAGSSRTRGAWRPSSLSDARARWTPVKSAAIGAAKAERRSVGSPWRAVRKRPCCGRLFPGRGHVSAPLVRAATRSSRRRARGGASCPRAATWR